MTEPTASDERELRQIVDLISATAEWAAKEPCDVARWEVQGYCREKCVPFPDRAIRRLGGFAAIKAAHFPPQATAEARIKRKVQVVALANNRIGRANIDEAETFAEVEAHAKRVARHFKVPPLLPCLAAKPVVRNGKASDVTPEISRYVLVVLCDWHLGLNLDGKSTGGPSFNAQDEARHIAEVTEQICGYNMAHRRETGLIAFWGGDLFGGEIHGRPAGNAAPLSEQISRTSWYGLQMLTHFGRAFRQVDNHFTFGNHGHFAQQHGIVELDWDTHEMGIYSGWHFALEHVKHMTWNIPRSASVEWTTFGKRYYGTHGHRRMHVGDPGTKLDVGNIARQVDRLQASRVKDGGFKVVITAHKHFGFETPLSNGVHFILGGPLVPVDEFAVGEGYFGSVSTQFACEITPDHPVGNMRWITLDDAVRNHAGHDKVIRIWKGF